MKRNTHAWKLCAAIALAAGLALPAAASIFTYDANLSGPNENPANSSPGTGFAQVVYDDSLHSLQIELTFSGLTGTTTASHIHAPASPPGSGTAGVATTTPYFTGFPIGVTSGSYSNTLDLTASTSWNGSYITANGGTTAGAESALAAAMAADQAYLNIHTTTFGGGEIRGFLVPVPEPSSVGLLALGGLVWTMRRFARAR
jgi:hypothetical protein